MNQNRKSSTTLLPCAGLIYIQNKKLLLACSSKKQCFYLPGGKIDAGESALQALCREVFEEMNVQVSESDLKFYTHISAPAYGEEEGTVMEQDCYLLNRAIFPIAAAEIAALKYFSLEEYKAENNIAPGAMTILKQLKREGLIN